MWWYRLCGGRHVSAFTYLAWARYCCIYTGRTALCCLHMRAMRKCGKLHKYRVSQDGQELVLKGRTVKQGLAVYGCRETSQYRIHIEFTGSVYISYFGTALMWLIQSEFRVIIMSFFSSVSCLFVKWVFSETTSINHLW